MADLVIRGFVWDDENLKHASTRHGIRPRIAHEVASGVPLFRENQRQKAASHQMIGPDAKGVLRVICIVEVGQDGSGMWRVVTGWVAEKPEEDWYAENIGGATGGEKEEQ